MTEHKWSEVVVPSEMGGEERWRRNGEYVHREEAEAALDEARQAQAAAERRLAALRREVKGLMSDWRYGAGAAVMDLAAEERGRCSRALQKLLSATSTDAAAATAEGDGTQ